MHHSHYFLLFFLFFLTCAPEQTEVSDAFPISISPKDTSPIEMTRKKIYIMDYDSTKWKELKHEIPSIIIDLKYATADNFVGVKMYDCARAFLRPEPTKALAQIQTELEESGFGLKIFDGYRPRPIQQKLWNKVPDKRYVTPPSKGSMHNRGAAVDLTIVDENGEELDMGTPYDFFGKEAWTEYQKLPKEVLANRILLHKVMAKYGFKSIRTEWWHFSFKAKSYPLSDWVWECESKK